MKKRTIAVRYVFFALLATALNLLLQKLVLDVISGPLAIYAAIGAGTAAGIVLKYALDCRFIFAYVNRPAGENLVTFILYIFMSGITTIVFWGVELAFNAIFAGEHAKYIGALVGLTIGYTAKYQLDRRFVFSRKTAS